MKQKAINYYLPLFKSSGNYLRITRNSAFVITCPASLKRQIDKCCSILLVSDESLTKFVIVGFTDKPYYKVFHIFDVRSKIDERIKFMMRQRMNRHMLSDYPLATDSQLSALDSYLDSSGVPLFS